MSGEFNYLEVEIAGAVARLSTLDDATFVAVVRKLETEFPGWRDRTSWLTGVRRELDFRLLLKR